MNNQAQHFVACWFTTIFFLSYYFLEFDEFAFYDTYNSRLNERYKNDHWTYKDIDPDLWLETGSSSGPNRNRMYGLSNTTTENLQTVNSISTIECSQSIPSTQTLEFEAMLDQRVQDWTTHLNEKYERLTVDYEELYRVVMKMRS